MAAPTPTTTVKARLSLAVGDTAPVEVSTFDVPVNWTLEKGPYGWSATVDTSGLDSFVKGVGEAIDGFINPESAAEPEPEPEPEPEAQSEPEANVEAAR